ncbi:MAG: ADP-ribosylglycohydrolase family protein [Clostridiales bacterium]|nr:ADP-ribosylglycohydrolase family protein [Clostridiales bacterium]
MSVMKYSDKIYAGVLGKIIGVYMGRPVEGWSYDAIRSRFGYVDYYVAHETGAPFIVPDDDISGTFVFYRALEDNGYPENITAEQVGEAWLNYIVEDKTILWWGGLARSTEHSAYLRLKAGIQPPASGSGEQNGMAIAEQIGSQIFIDTWAMANPANPARAAKMARQAAMVSHDGIAIECAVYLAALESMAFVERDVDVLLRECRQYIGDNAYGKQLNALLDDVIAKCDAANDWREVRDWIEEHHNYARYQGNCPMVPNHLSVIMALKMGGDDFRKSVAIAVSAGWDTDCNAANTGCLNAIRLGLDSINADTDMRGPVADRMYVVSTDGGDCIFDAVREARKILRAAAALNGESIALPTARYAFEYPGSVQGFMPHPSHTFGQAVKAVCNAQTSGDKPGLAIAYSGVSGGVTADVSVQTYVDPSPKAAPDTSYFEVYASPALYSGQTVRAVVDCRQRTNPELRFFIDYYDANDEIDTMLGEQVFSLEKGENTLEWEVPDTHGRAIYRLGIRLSSDERKDGEIVLRTLDWKGSPKRFYMGKANELTPGISPFVIRTKWMIAFMNSTKHTGPDYLATFAISHPERNGVLTIGTTEWDDYAVASRIQFVHAKYAGLVARAKGHRRYYAAVFRDGSYQIIKRKGGELTVLATSEQSYAEGDWHDVRFEVEGEALSMYIDGKLVVHAADTEFRTGAAGYVADEGAIVASTFAVTAR